MTKYGTLFHCRGDTWKNEGKGVVFHTKYPRIPMKISPQDGVILYLVQAWNIFMGEGTCSQCERTLDK